MMLVDVRQTNNKSVFFPLPTLVSLGFTQNPPKHTSKKKNKTAFRNVRWKKLLLPFEKNWFCLHLAGPTVLSAPCTACWTRRLVQERTEPFLLG